MSVAILESKSAAVLASGESGMQALKYEGNWYFDPSAVDQSLLTISDRTYTCPIKGVCHWVDFNDTDGRKVKDVAWIYPKTKKGHEAIAGRFGFYAGSRNGTREEG